MKKPLIFVLVLICIQIMVLAIMEAPAAPLTWTPAVLIETGTRPTHSLKIAAEPSGNVMAVWVQDDGTDGSNIYANLYVNGSGWGTPTLLETSIMVANSPQIAADANGNFIALWKQAWRQVDYTGGSTVRYGIYANRYVARIGWGTATAVYVDATKDYISADAPQIAIQPNGNAMSVWTLYSWADNHTSSLASRYVVGTGWGAATTMESGDNSANSPRVALDSLGNAIVMWVEPYGSSVPGIYASRYDVDVGAGWVYPVRIDSSTGNEGWQTGNHRIAFDPDGNAIAVWSPTGKSGIIANRYVAGTGWGTAEAIADASICDGSSQGVQIAFDKDGNALAVWNDSGNYCSQQLFANRYVVGTGWGTTDLVSPYGNNYSEQVAVNQTGNAIAVWANYSCNSSNIYASLYVAGTGWSVVSPCDAAAPSIVNTTLNNAGSPQIVIDGNGNVTVVWEQNGHIYANHLCTFALSPASASWDGKAHDGTVGVTSACAWTATSNDSWITTTSGASGSGNGSVAYSVTTNTTDSARTGTMTIGGQTFTVTQAAVSYTQTQLNEAVAVANAAKDLIIADKNQTITGLNATIASMFTKEQVDQAVLEERLKWDVNGDGKMGLEVVIYILQKAAGMR